MYKRIVFPLDGFDRVKRASDSHSFLFVLLLALALFWEDVVLRVGRHKARCQHPLPTGNSQAQSASSLCPFLAFFQVISHQAPTVTSGLPLLPRKRLSA